MPNMSLQRLLTCSWRGSALVSLAHRSNERPRSRITEAFVVDTDIREKLHRRHGPLGCIPHEIDYFDGFSPRSTLLDGRQIEIEFLGTRQGIIERSQLVLVGAWEEVDELLLVHRVASSAEFRDRAMSLGGTCFKTGHEAKHGSIDVSRLLGWELSAVVRVVDNVVGSPGVVESDPTDVADSGSVDGFGQFSAELGAVGSPHGTKPDHRHAGGVVLLLRPISDGTKERYCAEDPHWCSACPLSRQLIRRFERCFRNLTETSLHRKNATTTHPAHRKRVAVLRSHLAAAEALPRPSVKVLDDGKAGATLCVNGKQPSDAMAR